MTLDEDDTDDMLVVARHEHGMIADEHADGGLLGNLAKLHSFEDDGVPPLITDPLRFPTLRGVREPIEDCHDAVVAQDTFESCCWAFVFSWDRGRSIFTAILSKRQSRALTVTLYFFDTHAHIQRSRDGRGADVAALLQRAHILGVRAVLAPAVDRDDWDGLGKIATIPGIELYFAWGLHPFFVLEVTPTTARELLEELKSRLASAPAQLRAVGECGLDFLRARTPEAREHQLEVFRCHLELSRDTGFPLSMHCVHAHGPMLELLRERPTPPSVMHAFSGSAELAREFVTAGHYISFAGNLLLANARKPLAAAKAVPMDKLLIETDSPDQTPPDRRPADNEPAFIVDVAQKLANLRGMELGELARTTFENAQRVFRTDLG